MAQVPASVSNSLLRVEQPVETDQRVRPDRGVHHVDLKSVGESGVHELHGDPYRDPRCGPDAPGHLTQPPEDLDAIVRERVTRQRGREILLHEERWLPPSARQLRGRIAVLALTERLRKSREVILHRRYHQKPAGSGEVPPSAHQREVVAKRAIPAPPLPCDGPALTAGPRPRGASLD